MASLVDEVLANRRRVPAMGEVISVAPADGMCTVLLSDGEVPARLADHMLLAGPTAAVVAGDVVALLPIGDTYLVVASVGSSAGGGGTAPSLGSNLLPNPGFEFGDVRADGWSGWPWMTGESTDGRDTTPGEAVSGSARALQHLPAGVGVIATTWTSAALVVDPGVTYRVSAWVKASLLEATLNAKLVVISAPDAANANFFGDGETVHTAATVVSPGAAYQLISGDVTIPSGDGYARLFLRSEADPAADLTVSWDETAFQQRIT